MDANWNLLADLIEHNRKHGDKTDREVIETFINGYKALNEFKDEDGKINVEYALQKIETLLKVKN